VITAGEFFAALRNAGQSGYGILVAVVGAGMLVGLLSTAPLAQRIGPERLFAPGIGIAGLALGITAIMPTLLAATAPAFLMGVGAGVAFIVGYTVLQRNADDRIRGRTFGAFNSGVRAAIFGSTVIVPVMIGLLGRERRVLTTLDDGSQALLYPYTFGGVRITLLLAAGLAIVGAIATGRTLHRAVRADARADALQLSAEPFEPTSRRGIFVAFEGGDGAGKSTQIRLLRNAIERAGSPVVVTREPGGTALGEVIRDVLLDPDSASMTPRTEALLYAAARAQHVDEVIVPALDAGAVVLSDRFVDSSVVYQGVARELGDELIVELNRWATVGLEPDLTVLLDVDPVEGLRRAVDGREPDRLEGESAEFHARVRTGYLERAARDPSRYLVLDGTRPVEELHHEIRDAVLARLEPKVEA
ncbi:MAG: dTMP kinase, partial [Nitriliruptoraceae bacterium]